MKIELTEHELGGVLLDWVQDKGLLNGESWNLTWHIVVKGGLPRVCGATLEDDGDLTTGEETTDG